MILSFYPLPARLSAPPRDFLRGGAAAGRARRRARRASTPSLPAQRPPPSLRRSRSNVGRHGHGTLQARGAQLPLEATSVPLPQQAAPTEPNGRRNAGLRTGLMRAAWLVAATRLGQALQVWVAESLTFACVRAAGHLSFRFGHLQRHQRYPGEALGELRAMRPCVHARTARTARDFCVPSAPRAAVVRDAHT